MSIFSNTVSIGGVTRKSQYDSLYNGSVLANTGGTPGGAQSIPGAKTFEATATFETGFIASGPCTYYAPVSGEESVGTLHMFPANSTGTYVATNWLPTAAGQRRTYNFASVLPDGVKAVQVSGFVIPYRASGGAVPFGEMRFYLQANNTDSPNYNTTNASVINVDGYMTDTTALGLSFAMPVAVDTNKYFYGYVESIYLLSSVTIYLRITGYYI